MIRDTTRRFVDEHSEASSLPEELILHMDDLDFNAPDMEGYGSPNVRRFAYEPLMQELEAGDSGVRSMASVQSALVMWRSNIRTACDQSRIVHEMSVATVTRPTTRRYATWRTSKPSWTYEGAHDIHTLVSRHNLTGIPAYE